MDMKEALYRTGREIARTGLGCLADLTIGGKDNVPLDGSYIVIFNHPPLQSRLLYLGLICAIPSRFSVLKLPLAAYPNLISRFDIGLIGLSGIIDFISIGGPSGFKKALETLSLGNIIALSPEGDAGNEKGLIRAKPGITPLAEKSHVPILPLAIFGPGININIGPPFYLKAIPCQVVPKHEYNQQQADMIMLHLACLLPPEKRGYYASM